ncbi:MAG TPA: FtsH protease activity modulator HflK [Caulobacteraceae bacterium]|jgi:membrane protease subunit HflK|nr:FtsH protease activity modulator HflK [Caulobacteraceae bacterium]
MPWNDNSNPGPWGAPGGGAPKGGDGDKPEDKAGDGGGRKGSPWGPAGGGRPSGDAPRKPRPTPNRNGSGPPQLKGPDIDELIGQLREHVRRFTGGAGPGGLPKPGVFAAIAGAAFAAWALSGLYIVQPDQEAVITRFGAYARSEGPGLRYHLPTPIEAVEKVSVTALNRLDVGGSAGSDIPAESLMLTGDENIVDLNFSVQWRVSDAARYLFRLTDPEAAVKMTAESAMREVIGKARLQAILTTGRGQVQNDAAELMQKTLDSWGAGVTIVEVQIRTANPPQEVIAAFREVANAGQDAEAAINEANTYRNRVINEAKGDAARITQAAQAYREQVVREAQGEADRFAAIDAEYKRAPAVTRQRLYTETMERILRNSNKVVVDTPKGGTAPIVLPPDLLRDRRTPPAAPPAAAPPAAVQTQTQNQTQEGSK